MKNDAKTHPDGVARTCLLPNDDFSPAWTSIKVDPGVRERLLAQALLSLTVRQQLAFEVAPLHGLILLTGPPGTGKTTLGRGLANQVAKQLPGTRTTFVEVDPHALVGSSLGKSQQAVAKLFEQTIPEATVDGVTVVLLDEIETLAASRHRLSLEANPIDVHRATDAALAGMDRLTRDHRNVLLIATTNFPEALDSAVISRADHIEEIGLPNAVARASIIADTFTAIGSVWTRVKSIERHLDQLATASEGLDGRRIRKAVFAAMASNIEVAKDPNRLTHAHVEAAFRQVLSTFKGARQ